MELHVLHDEGALEVNDERPGRPGDLSDLLCDLSFVRASPADVRERLVLSIHPSAHASAAPSGGRRVVLDADALHITESGEDLYISDGASLLHVQARRGSATAQIA